MKSIYSVTILFFTFLSATAQPPQLFGIAMEGGQYQGGVLFSLDGDGSNFQKRFDFKQDAGFSPMYNQLLDGGDGYLYGLASTGGKYSDGVVFRLRLSDYRVEVVHEIQNFIDGFYLDNHQEGNEPRGSLIAGSDGNFYGTCWSGGSEGQGTIFSINPASGAYNVVFNFQADTTGSRPSGSLIQLPDGLMYGTTGRNGGSTPGQLFSFHPATGQYNELITLFETRKQTPSSTLLYAADGKLYGTVYGKGFTNQGKFFRFNPSDDTFEILVDFSDSGLIGKYPAGKLLQSSNGKIYSMLTHGNDGGIYSFNPSNDSFAIEHYFDNSQLEGAQPEGGLFEATDGWLYGATSYGGLNGYGTLFRFNINTNVFGKLHDFTLSEAYYAEGTFMQASDGLLYGVSKWGGEDNKGTIFSFNPQNFEVKTVYTFRISDHGSHPTDGLVQNVNGKLYGFTHEGGNYHAGAMFSLDPSNDSLQEYFEYREDLDAAYLPRGTLSMGANGKYYGAALYHFDGGATIYTFDPGTLQYQIAKEVNSDSLGEKPEGKMILFNGNFYGTMSRGGTKDYGVIYRFNPLDTSYSVLYDITDSTLGIHPTGSFAEHNGFLYGMMDQGGAAGQGTLFRFDPVQMNYEKLIDFVDSINGKNPAGRLIVDADNLLYGNTTSGGAKKDGTLFSFNPLNNQLTTLVNFNDSLKGSKPKGTLLLASDHALYGTTSEGGSFNYGTIFRYDPASQDFTVLHHFNSADGRYPEGELMEWNPSLSGIEKANDECIITAFPNPFNEFTSVKINNLTENNMKLTMTDVTGKIFREKSVSSKLLILERENIPSGIYFIQLIGKDGRALARMKIAAQ